MERFSCLESEISIGSLQDSVLGELLRETYKNAKKVILVDENTKELCLPFLFLNFDGLEEAEIIEIPAGEENKSMEICFSVWEAMSEMELGRNDLLICLGGGVICDMGGFIASIYKRGMPCVYIPTSLLAMVDASLGGKTGVDVGAYKNQLGTFSFPSHVFIDLVFLETLPEKEKLNGLAEMLKHVLIAEKDHFSHLATKKLSEIDQKDILFSLQIKRQIVESDPRETGPRKMLNFGHSVGHAIEGYFLNTSKQISHGLAVAHGMLAESYLSFSIGLLSENEMRKIHEAIHVHFAIQKFSEEEINAFLQLMRQDKKNVANKFRMSLLKEIGMGVYDIEVEADSIKKALIATLSIDV